MLALSYIGRANTIFLYQVKDPSISHTFKAKLPLVSLRKKRFEGLTLYPLIGTFKELNLVKY